MNDGKLKQKDGQPLEIKDPKRKSPSLPDSPALNNEKKNGDKWKNLESLFHDLAELTHEKLE